MLNNAVHIGRTMASVIVSTYLTGVLLSLYGSEGIGCIVRFVAHTVDRREGLGCLGLPVRLT